MEIPSRGIHRPREVGLSMSTAVIQVPFELVQKWQEIVDVIAEIIHVPSALVMKVEPPNIKVFVSSVSNGNPYERDELAPLNTGLYCETVMKTRQSLLVPDALRDEEWKSNPDIKLGMISYLGFPVTWPDGQIFGTICVLDRKENLGAAPDPLAGIGKIEHIVQLLTVVHGRVRRIPFADQLVRFVHAEVVLVAVEARIVLLRPARVLVLLGILGGLLLHPSGVLPALIVSFSSFVIALLGHRHNRGVNNLAAARNIALQPQDAGRSAQTAC